MKDRFGVAGTVFVRVIQSGTNVKPIILRKIGKDWILTVYNPDDDEIPIYDQQKYPSKPKALAGLEKWLK